MSKPYIILISIAVFIIILTGTIAATWYASKNYYSKQESEIAIEQTFPTTSIVNQVPSTPEEWEQWKLAKLLIQGKIEGDYFRVSCSDGFKSAETKFLLSCKPKEDKHIITISYVCLIGYGYNNPEWSHGVAVSYSYMITPMVGFNIGVMATQREGGISAGLTLKFK